MATYTITAEENPSDEDTKRVRDGLAAFNRQHTPHPAFYPITLLVRDAEGTVAGGLLGGIYWGWLYVEIFWLDEALRGQGLGTRLLRQAEQIAIERGCHGAHLDTMDFQARGFYERQGYEVYGTLDDMPRGHQRFFLKKALS
ncbi:MAG: GNAT family N-acetyltransferase [Roseiflexaceae bacterium]